MKVEDGDTKSAKKIVKTAEYEFRREIIIVLKTGILKMTRAKLKRDKPIISKQSYQAAEAKLAELEDFIDRQQKEYFGVIDLSADVLNRIQNVFKSIDSESPSILILTLQGIQNAKGEELKKELSIR